MWFRTRPLLSNIINHVPTRHPEKDPPDHHALSHHLPQNLDSPGTVDETDLNLLVVVLTVETERIDIGDPGEMTEILMDARSHAHAHHQNDAHPIVPARIGIINLAIGHLGFAAIAAA